MTETHLVRHGETSWNAEGRIQGWAPVPLSERGREQAERAAECLLGDDTLGDDAPAGGDVDAVVSSDLERSVETARIVADAAGVDVETDPRLRERDFGIYQGLRSAQLPERFPELDLAVNGREAAAFAPESGESWLEVRDRVLAAADDLLAREGTVVAVTHVNPIRLIAGERRGLDVVRSLTVHPADNCSVTSIDAEGELVRWNETTFLD